MTRKEAKRIFWTKENGVFKQMFDRMDYYAKASRILSSGSSLDEFIDKIYNDFESQTCESCKHFLVYNDSKQSGTCDNEESIAYTSKEAIYGDDGCNKWEERIDSTVVEKGLLANFHHI